MNDARDDPLPPEEGWLGFLERWIWAFVVVLALLFAWIVWSLV